MANKRDERIAVTERALFARLSRSLEKDGLTLRRCKETSNTFAELGSYYIVDRNGIHTKRVSLEQMSRKLDLLKPYERLEDA